MQDAVAIVGFSCRLPGRAASPDAFWRLLIEGRDAVTELGPGRFNLDHFYHPGRDEPGRSYTFAAGVLEDIRRFDAGFFGVSPREASQMDPQQRLLLELTYEALEGGGFPLSPLAGAPVAVYLGISGADYSGVRGDDPVSWDAYTMTGNTLSVAANRISHAFDWRGPSLAVDTACSSSLVAFHEAHRVVASGEAPMAAVAGVNMLLSPSAYVGFSQASMLAPDGRCRPFDARGQGYVRAEGGVVMLLKPVRQAEADGDRILGVVRGAGINADGRTRGIALPNGEAQQALLQRTYERAGVDPRELSYFEAHGTGTPVGDPIEARAIGQALGAARDRDQPLLLGSVKSNLGHLEPVSGLVGLGKALQILRHGVIPPSLHFGEPNPNIDFDGWNLRVVTHPQELPVRGQAPLIGVNSFGFGGANAHVIVEGYERKAGRRRSTASMARIAAEPLPPIVLSTRDEKASRRLAEAMAERLKGVDREEFYNVAWTAAFRREFHPHRLMVRGAHSVEQVRALLLSFADPESDSPPAGPATLHHAVVSSETPLAWVFTGSGCQSPGMMVEWLKGHPGAREALIRVDAVMAPLLGWSVLEYLELPPEEQEMDRVEVAQPLVFAVQAAMVDLLRQAGAVPALVIGHSLGEVAAAYASGGMTLEEAAWVIEVRSRMVAGTAGMGTMAAAGLTEKQAQEWITAEGVAPGVAVAGVNSPKSVTLTGDRAGLERLAVRAEAEGVFYMILNLDYPFHSTAMDPMQLPILEELDGLEPKGGDVPFISTVTGGEMDPALLVADYWWHNLRQPVQFGAAVESAIQRGVSHFLEVSPHGVLGQYVRECREEAGVAGGYFTACGRGKDEVAAWVAAQDAALLAGGAAQLADAFPFRGELTDLPSYPWDETHYWFTPSPEALPRVHGSPDHPLLGVRSQGAPALWERAMDPELIPWLAHHRVEGSAVFPAAAFLEMALATGQLLRGGGKATPRVERLEIRRPLIFHPREGRWVQTLVSEEGDRVTIRSRPRSSRDGWVEHAVATLAEAHLPPEPLPEGSLSELLIPENLYRGAAEQGLEYGKSFQVLRHGKVGTEAAEGHFRFDDQTSVAGMFLAPTLVDGAFQLLLGVLGQRKGGHKSYLPVAVGSCYWSGETARLFSARARVVREGARSLVADFDLLDESGGVVAALRDCRFQVMARRGKRAWFDSILTRKEVDLGQVRRVALLAPAHADAVGRWTAEAELGQVELVVSHPNDEVRNRLRAELPALPNLEVRGWDDPMPCHQVEVLSDPNAGGPVLPEGEVAQWRMGASQPETRRSWVVVGESKGAPEVKRLVESIGERGDRVDVLALPLAELAAGKAVDKALAGHRDAQIWLLAHGGGAAYRVNGAKGSDPDPLLLTQGALALARSLRGLMRTQPTQLCALIPPREAVPEGAGIPALFRVLANEMEGVDFRTVEVGQGTEDGWLQAWAAHPDELELRVERNVDDEAHPIRTSALRLHATPGLQVDENANVRLAIPAPGLLDRLRWEETGAGALAEGQVRIGVRAVGLNFRDVMWALGFLPEEAVENGFAGASLGMECAGEVLEVGEGVTSVSVGDRVLAFAPHSFGTEVTTPAGVVARLPDSLSFPEAATLPVAFFTAHYALNTLARLQPGERVLIHGGAGGVGLAAIQVAQEVGAEIFATAGTKEKRALLRKLGVQHVLHSRDLSFADGVREATDGKGVDVVLNSLAGEAMQASLELLRPFGRFLELGKRDFYQNSRLAMRALRNNISYHGIDADQLLAVRPAETQALFQQLMARFESGALSPLPHRVYDANRVEEAFRAMQQSRHIGKVVITMEQRPRQVAPKSRGFHCNADASYLVVGGMGGFGLAAARWLVASGARTLVLASRRGEPGSEGAPQVAALQAQGVRVELLSLDVADREQVDGMLGELEHRGVPPLRGIIHAAMVLDDRSAMDTDAASVARVWHPKVMGAVNLDRATRALPLDWTVYFSSATTALGNPGQGNYVAANRALEALAEARSEAGHPTLAVAFGPIADAGYLVRNPHVREILTRRLGREPLTAEEALQTLGELLSRGVTGVRVVLPMTWKRVRRSLLVSGDAAYRWLENVSARQVEEREDTNLQELTSSLSPKELRTLLLEVMTEQLAHILRMPQEQIEPDRPLEELGMDSLMLVELAASMERQFGVELPMMALSDGVTVRQVAERIAKRLRGNAHGEGGSGDGEKTVEEPVRVVAGVRFDEASALLGQHSLELSDEDMVRAADEIEEILRASGGKTSS